MAEREKIKQPDGDFVSKYQPPDLPFNLRSRRPNSLSTLRFPVIYGSPEEESKRTDNEC